MGSATSPIAGPRIPEAAIREVLGCVKPLHGDDNMHTWAVVLSGLRESSKQARDKYPDGCGLADRQTDGEIQKCGHRPTSRIIDSQTCVIALSASLLRVYVNVPFLDSFHNSTSSNLPLHYFATT
jgi:hypothetical protein